jgi:hypothetical protein
VRCPSSARMVSRRNGTMLALTGLFLKTRWLLSLTVVFALVAGGVTHAVAQTSLPDSAAESSRPPASEKEASGTAGWLSEPPRANEGRSRSTDCWWANQ